MLKPVIDFILYSNGYIAFCAVALTFQTQLLLGQPLAITPLIGLIFFATLLVYALHRLLSLYKVQAFLETGRYFVINKFKSHIWFYAVIAAIGSSICFFYVSWAVRWALIIPAFFSLGYVLPVFRTRKRLRDFHYIKIFLVAVVWAYVTVILPVLEIDTNSIQQFALLFLERAVFIFAITLPFDIRDLKLDEESVVKTIPLRIGINNTVRLALGLLGIFLLFTLLSYPLVLFPAFVIIAIITGLLIWYSPKQQHDYYFTGLIDGTMWMQFAIIYLYDMSIYYF